MLSAFGVEHSEVSKAIKLPGMPKMPKPGLLKPLGQSMGAGVKGMSKPLGQSAGRSMAGGHSFMGGAQKQMGMGASRAGKAMMARPGLTGGMAVGGAAAGVGGVGYGLGRSRNRHSNGQIR